MAQSFWRGLSVVCGLLPMAASWATNDNAVLAAAAKAPASKTFTSFTGALRCMDDLLLAYGKKDIVITSAGLPDATGKIAVGTKEMLISAVAKMSIKSKAFSFIDYETKDSDLATLFNDLKSAGVGNRIPNYYIRGAITQLDDNALDSQKGFSIALPFLDFGLSRDQVQSLVSVDMSVVESASRTVLPETSSSNTMIITRAGRSNEGGGKIGKAGLSINMSLNKSEGAGAAVRALVELGLVETVGRLTKTPYWKCLDIDGTNPSIMQQAQEWYDGQTAEERVKFIQRKLGGMADAQGNAMYKGALDGKMNPELSDAIGRYQADNGLIANGKISFELYYSLQNANTSLAVDSAPSIPSLAARPKGHLALKMDTDRGETPVYRTKEYLTATATLSGNGALYCYYQDAGGAIARIFPNRFQSNPRLQSGQALQIPGNQVPFKIRFDKANSQERILCLANANDMAVPNLVKGEDLRPLPVKGLEEITQAFRQLNPGLVESYLNVRVQ